LHWAGGVVFLLEHGALSVKEFSAFESAPGDSPKAVFLLTKPLWGQHLQVLKEVIVGSQLEYCVIVTAVHPMVQFQAKYGHDDGNEQVVIEWLKEQVLEWMGNKNYTVEVLYIPMCGVSVCPELFVVPSLSDLFPLMESDLTVSFPRDKKQQKPDKQMVVDSMSALEYVNLSPYSKNSVKELVYFLHSLCEKMNVKDDIFYMGDFSRVIATELCNLYQARNRRKTATNKISIMLVDRTLDLATATSFTSETLLDSILMTLHRLPGHTNDVCVDVSPLCTAHSCFEGDSPAVFPGCLAHPQDADCVNILSAMLLKKPKKCLMDINQVLVKRVTRESLPLNVKPGVVTTDTIDTHITSLKSKPALLLRHSAVLQQSLAAIQALQSSRSHKCDDLLGLQTLLTHGLGAKGSHVNKESAPAAQILQLIKTRRDRAISIEDIILLLVHIYSLSNDPFSPDKDDKIQAAVSEAMAVDMKTLSDTLIRSIRPPVDELSIHSATQVIFNKLRAIGKARAHLRKYRELLIPTTQLEPASRQSLLGKVMRDVLDPTVPVTSDIEYKVVTMKEKFKSGFGQFLGITKPKPSDSQVFLLFVVGGITAGEVKVIREAATNIKTCPQVIIGSTRLLQPFDTLDLVLLQKQGVAPKTS